MVAQQIDSNTLSLFHKASDQQPDKACRLWVGLDLAVLLSYPQNKTVIIDDMNIGCHVTQRASSQLDKDVNA